MNDQVQADFGAEPSGAVQTVDLLVFGGGVAGMTAALVGRLRGLDVLLCEKTSQVGGITSTSGATTWVPGSTQSKRAGVPDSVAQARTFLDAIVGDRGGRELREAFLASGAAAIDELEASTDVKFAAALAHPDYLDGPGSAYGGRALGPLPFDGRKLEADFARVRPPRSAFLVLGGMMVQRSEIAALLKPFASITNFLDAMTLLIRQGRDRLSWPRGTRLVMGNALVARLLYSLRKQNVPILFDTALAELVRDGDTLTGAIVDGPGGRRVIRARRGVVMATGGIAQNKALREKLFPKGASGVRSLAPETNSGDGVTVALRAGAMLDDGRDSPALWMPCSVLRHRDGREDLWPHILLDRAKPGLIAVNGSGRRFVNESASYHDFVMGMFVSDRGEPSIPAWLICDRSFIRDYGLGMVWAGTKRLRPFIRAGYLVEGKMLRDLAVAIGVDPGTFEKTVAEHNHYARTGVDEAFGRGSSTMNRFNGDPANKPNPCMRPIARGPFYAMAVWPADLASSAGLRGDADGRVLDQDGAPIKGLYVCGNDMTSIFRGTYPGPGTTIGPAIVFAWRVANHVAGNRGGDIATSVKKQEIARAAL